MKRKGEKRMNNTNKMKICKNCGRDISKLPKASNRKYCSTRCGMEYREKEEAGRDTAGQHSNERTS